MANPFVEKFTPEEAQAVAKLKTDLPEILEEAHGSKDVYTLWSVPLDKESTDQRLEVLLVKFIRARDLSLPAARKMLVDTLKWRKEFYADNLLSESFDEAVFNPIGYIHGHDKQGRLVCYNFYGELDQDKVFADVETFVRWRVQLMEKCVQEIDFVKVDAMIQVHDYKGASMLGRSSNAKQATKQVIQIMKDNYPEFLAIKFFVNVPWWGSKIFTLIKPMLPEATIKKFVVCANDQLLATLEKTIDRGELPKVYVGDTYKVGSVLAAIQASREEKDAFQHQELISEPELTETDK
ncbi:CRAL/TRIO domain-containing protein [Hesseltinella vesiculosa]|uniref:CRAL/TRIO domain-containing protein n=1 Tax=Hesseltinella vesiculosa TaxID=101127 RepID=A0A1X2GBV4_9FUNG|nr:CRAL/TRIO domain-containing protein [Hesseltinella vesiculosa]